MSKFILTDDSIIRTLKTVLHDQGFRNELYFSKRENFENEYTFSHARNGFLGITISRPDGESPDVTLNLMIITGITIQKLIAVLQALSDELIGIVNFTFKIS